MNSSPIRVLMMGDNVADVYLVRTLISVQKHLNIQFDFVETLHEGLSFLKRNPVDVVLMDLNLPDRRGIVAMKTLLSQARHVPVILLTRLQDTDIALDGIRMGAQDYLVKNRLDSEDLVRAILCSIERERVNQESDLMQESVLIAS